MLNKIFISFLIICLINLLVGCYTSDQISSNEIQPTQEKIIQVVYANGNVVDFNKIGAKYKEVENGVMGTNTDGEIIIVSFEEISELIVQKPKEYSLSAAKSEKIIEIVTYSNRLYRFNDLGGVYNKEDSTVTGTTDNGLKVRFKTSLINEYHLAPPETVTKEKLKTDQSILIEQIVLQGSRYIISFESDGGTYAKNVPAIYGVTNKGKFITIPLSEILYVNVEKINTITVVMISVVLITGLVLAIIAIGNSSGSGNSKSPPPKEPTIRYSCPFIYSYNAPNYYFDAQPLGGAITRGLQRTDLSKLDYLNEEDGKYKLLIRNEMEETQYIDAMSLVVTDHSKNSEIITDLEGNFYQITNPILPTSANDENGMDLLNFVKEVDNISWQTKLPMNSDKFKEDTRHHLTFTFPKPQNKKNAKLVINAGTSEFGSSMIKEFLMLYGKDVDSWYNYVDNIEGNVWEKDEILCFTVREELFFLNYYIYEDNDWNKNGAIFGGGPYVNETHIYDLNLENVSGDSLTINLNPPYGFWTIDYIAVEYESSIPPIVREINFTKAENQLNEDILKSLNRIDNKYYVMPETTDYFFAEANSLAPVEEMSRTFFVKSTGYYKIHLPKDKPIQMETIYNIVNTPGKVIEYSMETLNEKLLTIR